MSYWFIKFGFISLVGFTGSRTESQRIFNNRTLKMKGDKKEIKVLAIT